VPQLPCCSDAAIDASLPSIAIDTAVRKHASEGRPVYRIHAERLAALAPNVIITQNQCRVCAGATRLNVTIDCAQAANCVHYRHALCARSRSLLA
jgi:iron complex transport system substrate-binding protein